MLTAKSGPKLLEYNVRLGDPETQAVLPLMDFDFSRMCAAIIDGSLDSFPFAWKRGYQCAPVAVSRGYPGSYPKGLPLSIDESAVARLGAKVFVAGAAARSARGRAVGRHGPLVSRRLSGSLHRAAACLRHPRSGKPSMRRGNSRTKPSAPFRSRGCSFAGISGSPARPFQKHCEGA